MKIRLLYLAVAWLSVSSPAAAGGSGSFPKFSILGFPGEAESLGALFELHYSAISSRNSCEGTLWDEWLLEPTIWPDGADHAAMVERWRRDLEHTIVDEEGYVSSMMHISASHPLGWPIPPGYWSDRSAAWYFGFGHTAPPPYRYSKLSDFKQWSLVGAKVAGLGPMGQQIELTGAQATALAPAREITAAQAPFLLLVWRCLNMEEARPYIEWTTDTQPDFSPERRVYFQPAAPGNNLYHYEGKNLKYGPLPPKENAYIPVPMYRHPDWRGTIRRLRIGFGNPAPDGIVTLQAVLTSFDTRMNINNASWIHACADFFRWTGDVQFLRQVMPELRRALAYMRTEFAVDKNGCILTPWVGHDGRSGVVPDGSGGYKVTRGLGLGSNYWDLLAFGYRDSYATIRYYDAVLQLADLESAVSQHPEWDIPHPPSGMDAASLKRHASEVRDVGNRIFWNEKTGRFIACLDIEGRTRDYGYTFLNLESIYYGFATPEHARQIMSWMDGQRLIEGDTSRGADIYAWRFAPRSSTLQNTDWYAYWWRNPGKVPWGGQVQDGGAVLGFSYQDIMARLKVLGPDNAWQRLREIARWYQEVRDAGGYRAYYDGKRPGTLQGGGSSGGLGLDCEFWESVMLPNALLRGFAGFSPTADGFQILPQLPAEWQGLEISRIGWRDASLHIKVREKSIEVMKEGRADAAWVVVPEKYRRVTYLNADGSVLRRENLKRRAQDQASLIDWKNAAGLLFEQL